MERTGLDPDPWQRDLCTSDWGRCLMNCARQTGKTTAAAALALETALSDPDALVLILAPARRQSKELLQTIRLMYWDAGPETRIVKRSELRLELENGSRIIALPGKEETIRGYTADLVLADEAARVEDSLYEAAKPMLAVSGGRLVALSTPAGKRGWFYEAWTDPEQEWERVEVTGWECPRLSDDFLRQERRELGEYIFAQEYECRFADRVGALFGRDEIEAAVSEDIPPLFDGGGTPIVDSDLKSWDL